MKTAGAPIGWSTANGKCEFWSEETSEKGKKPAGDAEDAVSDGELNCLIPLPKVASGYFWLLLGGLLVGLGAPFWAKAIRQITDLQQISKNITGILKPEAQAASGQPQQAPPRDDLPITTKAFDAAAAGQKLKQ